MVLKVLRIGDDLRLCQGLILGREVKTLRLGMRLKHGIKGGFETLKRDSW